ncbi:heterokaryon incompatibility protein-domain-containing protein [Annulohypoxylon moriforme]|nr:heterokaryon incompatibility protein-domain-containing protein [Annulohypoxylon moriforme]
MSSICGCRRPTIQNVAEMLWMCTECGTEIPEDEELEDPVTQSQESQHIAKRSLLNLSWPRSVVYIEIDSTTISAIEECERIDSTPYLNEPESPPCQLGKGDEKYCKNSSFLHMLEAVREKYYQYKPLNSTQHKLERSDLSVRILRLSRGNPKDPLHGVLIPMSLSDDPNFDAVSYTWADETGDSIRRRPLYIGSSWHRLPITNNCASALRRFRQTAQELDLWIDSICIDQADLNERRQQVKLMPTIYSMANEVLVYLGAGSQTTSDAMFALGLQGESAEQYWHNDRYNEALGKLFCLPYFSRVWIIQELALAKQVRLYHGYDQQSVSLLHARDRIQQVFKATDPGTVIPLWLQHWGNKLVPPGDVGNLIFDGMSTNASLPEDKVFAFFGMIYGADVEGLVADYNLSVEQVYTGIAAYLVSRGHLLSILKRSNCGNSLVGRLNNHHPLNIPSWVPDFRKVAPRDIADLYLGPDIRPLYMFQNSFDSDTQPMVTEVVRETGSLILSGYPLINIESTEAGRCHYSKNKKQGIAIGIVFEELFDKSKDTAFLLCSKDGSRSILLHLRKAKPHDHHDNVHELVGLCEIVIKSRQVAYRESLSYKFISSHYKDDTIGLFSFGRPLLDGFYRLGKHALNRLWTIYRSLEKNSRIENLFHPRPSPCSQISENPWSDFQELVAATFANYGQYNYKISRIRTLFIAFSGFYDFWISSENQTVIRNLATIFREDISSIHSNYDDLWNEWFQDHNAAQFAVKELLKKAATLTAVNQSMGDGPQKRIEHWKNTTLKLISGLNCPKDFNQHLVMLVDEDTGECYILNSLKLEAVRKLLDKISSGIEKRIEVICQKHLNEGSGKDFAGKQPDHDHVKEPAHNLIGNWFDFIELLSWVPEGGTATDEIRVAFQHFQLLGVDFPNPPRWGYESIVKSEMEKVVII